MSRIIVLYAKEDMEPITVFRVPFTKQRLDDFKYSFRVVVPEDVSPVAVRNASETLEPQGNMLRTVLIEIIEFNYNGQIKKMFVTGDEELALLLRSDKLAGQTGDWQRQLNQAFTQGLITALK